MAGVPCHGSSLNRALNEALRIHGGPVWRIFQFRVFSPGFVVSSLLFFCVCASPDPYFLLLCLPAAGVGGSGSGEVRCS
jgi:hypothetical protein